MHLRAGGAGERPWLFSRETRGVLPFRSEVRPGSRDLSEREAGSGGVWGRCLCGAVRFEFALPTLACVHCHCGMCRRAHGAGFVTWIRVARAGFRMHSGSEGLVAYPSSEHGVRSFCGTCGSTLFCGLEREPDTIDIVRANLDGEIDRVPEAHIYFSDRASWVEPADALPRFGGPSGTEPLE